MIPALVVAAGWFALVHGPVSVPSFRTPAAHPSAGPSEDLASLKEVLRSSGDPRARSEAISAMTRVRAEPFRTEAFELLVQTIAKDPSRSVREYACSTITELYRTGDDLRDLAAIAGTPRAPGRLQALRAVARLRDPSTYDLLLALTRDPDREARTLAYSGIARFPGRLEGLEALNRALDERDLGIRTTGIIGLGSMLPRALPSLPRGRTREIFDSLARRLGDPQENIRSGSARLLALIIARNPSPARGEETMQLAERLRLSRPGEATSDAAAFDLFVRYSMDVVGFAGLPILASQGKASRAPTPAWTPKEIELIRRLGAQVLEEPS